MLKNELAVHTKMSLESKIKDALLQHWKNPEARAQVEQIIDKEFSEIFSEHTESYCSYCGARSKRYTHTLSSGLIDAFVAFAKHLHESGGASANAVNESGLDVNAATNFQKLKYFGLVKKSEKIGHWQLTKNGEDFLRGRLKVLNKATTFRGAVVRNHGELVHIRKYDVELPYWQTDFNEEPATDELYYGMQPEDVYG